MNRKYCLYCMQEMNEDICPYCGKKEEEAPIHHLKPGTMVNQKYMIGHALGEGGFGITYIGLDTLLNMKVAIKEYYPYGMANRNHAVSSDVTISMETRENSYREGKKKFLKEARILAQCTNVPGIVYVRDFFEANDTAYIVMEYLEGITLKSYLKKHGVIPEEKLKEWMLPLMESLEKVHNKGMIHRDISPDNIMLTENQTLKLMDFGAARDISGAGGRSLSVMLKPGYAPVEQYLSKGQQGPWTDIYALCATMYKCMTGVTPVESNQRVYDEEDELLRPSALGIRISRSMEDAIMKGMSILQKNRYQNISELYQAMMGQKDDDVHTIAIDIEDDVRTVAQEKEDGRTVAQKEERDDRTVVQTKEEDGRTIAQEKKEEERTVAQEKEAGGRVETQTKKDKVSKVIQNEEKGSRKTETKTEKKEENKSTVVEENREEISEMKKVKKVPLILGIIIGICFVAFFGITVAKELGKVEINGQKYEKDVSYVHIREQTIKEDTWEQLAKMENLSMLAFTECDFSEFNAFYWTKLENVTTINMIQCKIDRIDLSRIREKVAHLTIKNCNLSDEMAKQLHLPNLYSVNLSDNTELTDISFLESSKGVKTINLSNTKVEDISCLSAHTGIGEIDLSHTLVSDISYLAQNKGIQVVNLAHSKVKDIQGLSTCSNIRQLNLSGLGLNEISPIEACVEMRSLNLSNNELVDLAPLYQMIYLEELDASFNKLTSLEGLENATVLETVVLNNNMIEDIRVLEKSSETLKNLYAQHNLLKDNLILKTFVALEKINLSDNQIRNIQSGGSWLYLQYIAVNNNLLENLDFLKFSNDLRYADFSNNKITDISKYPRRLDDDSNVTLILSNNQIQDISELGGRFYFLCLDGNPLEVVECPIVKCAFLSIDYNPMCDYRRLNEVINRCYIVNVDLDKKVEAEQNIKNVAFRTFEEVYQEAVKEF